MKEAMFWKRVNNKVVCTLCPQTCVLSEGEVGKCGVRKVINNRLMSLSYGKVISMALDPVEKKPLFHFLPGSSAFSIATPGCNLKCKFCQNWEISQVINLPPWEIEPEKIVEMALKEGATSIAYTYTEPTIFYEFALDVAKIAKKAGLKNLWISNGYINEEPLRKIARYLDAANIDVKSTEDSFYREICGGLSAKIPLRTIRILRHRKVWVEATYLLIPGLNSSEAVMEGIAKSIANIGKDIPLHISRFHPAYLLQNIPPTQIELLEKALTIARQHLDFVYLGNVPGHEAESTYCPRCHRKVIGRVGFFLTEVNLEIKGNKAYCKFCGAEIPGVFSASS